MREGLVAVRRLRPRSCAKRGWSLFVTPKIQPDVIPCLHHFAQFSLHNYSVCVIDSGVALIDWFPDLNSFSWVRIGRRFVSVPSDVSQHLQRLLWGQNRRLVWGKFSASYVVNSPRKFFPQWECLFQPSSFHDDRLRYSPKLLPDSCSCFSVSTSVAIRKTFLRQFLYNTRKIWRLQSAKSALFSVPQWIWLVSFL